MLQLARFENTKQRYISSFLLSSLLFSLIQALLYLLLSNQEEPFKIQKEEFSRIAISTLVLNKPQELQKPITPKPVVEKKQIPKPNAKKAIPLPQKTKEKPQETVEEILQEPLVEKLQTQQQIQKLDEDQKIQKQAKALERLQQREREREREKEKMLLAKQEREAKQNLFIQQLRERINKNKSYPMSARRRSIEGSIEMQFYLLKNGQVKDISFISGKKTFQNSATEAIKKSFPIKVEQDLFTFPKKFQITLAYDII